MVKEIGCINSGFEDCDFLIRSENEEEVIEFAQQHARRTHDTEATPEHLEKVLVEV
jgi:predicted small metal-binding protein